MAKISFEYDGDSGDFHWLLEQLQELGAEDIEIEED